MVDEVCCRFRHPSATTRGTEAAAFAREGDEAIELARIAVKSQKAMCQHTAAEIGTQLLLDELGNGPALRAGSRQKGLEVLADVLMEERLLGAARSVGGRYRAGMSARGVGARRGFGHRPW